MEREKTVNGWLRDFAQVGLYKRSQGRVTRQVTFAALMLAVLLGAWRFSLYSMGNGPAFQYLVPGILILVGGWLCYRVVNVPRVADFLIAVEAEMAKVSWPSRTELVRSSIVVMVVIFGLGFLLFGIDIFWQRLLTLVGVML